MYRGTLLSKIDELQPEQLEKLLDEAEKLIKEIRGEDEPAD